MREFKAGFVLAFAIVAVTFSIDFRISNRFEENINRNYLEADMLQVEAKENSFNEESIDIEQRARLQRPCTPHMVHERLSPATKRVAAGIPGERNHRGRQPQHRRRLS